MYAWGGRCVCALVLCIAVSAANAQTVTAVGQHIAALLEAQSGKLLWRQDKDIDLVLPDGLQFDSTGQRLLIVAAQRDRRAGVSHLNLWSLNVADGSAERADLGKGPLDEAPKVIEIGTAPTGAPRVMLHDRIIEVPPEALQAQ